MNDANAKGDLVSTKPVGVSAPIRIFMMEFHDGKELTEAPDAFKDFFPYPAVLLNQRALFCRQLSGLSQDIFWNANLSDVVQLRTDTNDFHLRRRQSHGYCHRGGVRT